MRLPLFLFFALLAVAVQGLPGFLGLFVYHRHFCGRYHRDVFSTVFCGNRRVSVKELIVPLLQIIMFGMARP
jgi:hypothetical protein